MVLLAACLVLLFETRVGSLLPRLRGIAEARAEEILGNKIRLSIGSISGGILHPFVFSDIKIKDKNDTLLAPSLVIDSIRTNYRLRDLLLNKKDQGDLLNSKVKGYILFFNKDRIEFSGGIRQDSFDLDIWLPKGGMRIEGNITDDGVLSVKLKANHVKLYDFDITCDVNIKNKNMASPYDSKQNFEGEVEAKNLILNYKPFLDFKALYKIYDSKLEVLQLNFEDGITASGKILLKKPYDMNVVLKMNNINLGWLLFRLGFEEATSAISGTLNGKFELSGIVDALRLNSHFEIRKGTILTLDFDYLSASIKGDLPFVRIEDSRITRPSGYFVLAGEMDLRRLGKNNLFDDIRIVTDDNAITWDSLDTTNLQYAREVRMSKKINEEISLDLKKIVDEGTIGENIRFRDEVQFEYKLHPNDSLKMMVGQGEEFLGIEHKDKF